MLELFRELSFGSLVFRLALAVVFGGLLGLDRGRKGRAAGFRTYLLVCLGACLTMLLGQYLTALSQFWGAGTGDVARLGAQVISGIGFLGAGTIMVTEFLQVKGLTTAAGLWAAACMGLAIGAGFYTCVVLAFLLIFGAMGLLPAVERFILAHSRHMTLYVEVARLEDLGELLELVKAQEVRVREVSLDKGLWKREGRPNAVFSLGLPPGTGHERVLAAIAGLESVRDIKEL